MEIHTNDLVKSWHNILKNLYLNGARKQHTGILVYRLVEEILQEIRRTIALTLNGFKRRRTYIAEQRQFDESVAISDTVALTLVSLSSDCEGTEVSPKEINVRSFSDTNVKHTVPSNEDSLIAR